MIPSKKVNSLVDANNNTENPTFETSQVDKSCFETTSNSLENGFLDEECNRKTGLNKEKEGTITEDSEDIFTLLCQQEDKYFPGEPVIFQLIQAANLFQKLSLDDVRSLARTSTQLFKQVSPLISNEYMLYYHKKSVIKHYYPTKLYISTPNLEKLLSNPCFSKVHKVKFDDHFNFPINQPLPPSVTHAIFGRQFNQNLTTLSSNLTRIEFGRDFNVPISSENLPASLKQLTVGSRFNQPLDDLPMGLTHLELGNDFNLPIRHLPRSLTHLKLGFYFSSDVDSLPDSLTHLVCGYLFDKPINNLPKRLTHLELGYWFQRYISSLPASLQHVIFYVQYAQPVSHLDKNIQFKITVWKDGMLVTVPYPVKQPL
eukprot:TRINITY_DN500_c1_g1_i1.p1 TRINITY_DN500_c1_g1~~TRINITY_DN500_c1_g1_i1.p1  ORF type:complete len:371 (-),score=68.67 TRINITY_DN500_c1_g1_i1:251-1363(-)